MLFYVGKDLLRWTDQCLEYIGRDQGLRQKNIRYQSFAALLANPTPAAVQKKLRRWGVADYRSIFTRALGLNAVFAGPPDRASLSDELYETITATPMSFSPSGKTRRHCSRSRI